MPGRSLSYAISEDRGRSPASSGLSRSFDSGGAGPGGRSRLGAWALVLCGVCISLMVVLGLLGPSSTEAVFGAQGLLPPWFWTAHPSDLLVWVLVALVLCLGAGAVGLGLAAIRRGWAPNPGRLLAGGVVGVCAILCVPPLGTTDPLNYAAYGRIAALGLDPYRMTPFGLAGMGDPIGRLSIAEPWLHYSSVYGPLATVTEWAASAVGGTSMLRTVWLLSVLNGAAFIATGAVLLRLAGPDRARRVRSQLLWTLNPVLLWNVVAGPHIDAFGVLFVALAFWALRRSGAAAGLSVAAATVVKMTSGIFALPFAWSLWRDRRRLAAAAIAGSLAVAFGYGLTPRAVTNAARVSDQNAVGSPWPMLLRKVLDPLFGTVGGHIALDVLELTTVALLAALLLGVLVAFAADADDDIARISARPALAFAAAYLLGTAYVRPWYDAMAWVLVAFLPRSWFDLVLLAHTTLLTLTYDPGLPQELHPHWLFTVSLELAYRVVPLLQAMLLLGVIGTCLWRIRHRLPEARGILRRAVGRTSQT